MAKVILKNNFYGPDNHLHRKGMTKKTVVDIPDDVVPYLPSSAIVMERFLSGRMKGIGIKSVDEVFPPEGTYRG